VVPLIEKISTRLNTVNFVVYKFEDILQKIIPIFEKYPLITQKYLDFYYFKEVSYLISGKEHLTKKGRIAITILKKFKKNH
jgi:hypothetical protein